MSTDGIAVGAGVVEVDYAGDLVLDGSSVGLRRSSKPPQEVRVEDGEFAGTYTFYRLIGTQAHYESRRGRFLRIRMGR